FLVSNGQGRLFLRLTDKYEGGFVLVFLQMPVHAVIGDVEFAAHEPLPKRSVAGIERGVPVVVPAEQIAIFTVALREILLPETLVDRGIGKIGLAYEFRAGIVVLLFSPMNRNLRFRQFGLLLTLFHHTSFSHRRNLFSFPMIPG